MLILWLKNGYIVTQGQHIIVFGSRHECVSKVEIHLVLVLVHDYYLVLQVIYFEL